jgi:hypothetical protein
MLQPGEHATVPTTADELMIEALRTVERTSGLLNDLSHAIGRHVTGDDDHRFDEIQDLLRRRFSDCSGVHLFIAADNLHLNLPPDLQDIPGEIDSDE